MDAIPTEHKRLRACMLCSLIKTTEQFRNDGCDNCEDILNLKRSDNVYECTSPNFKGTIALIKPTESWVARWQRIDKFEKGVYALTVSGTLPQYILEDLEDRGISFKARDTSYE